MVNLKKLFISSPLEDKMFHTRAASKNFFRIFDNSLNLCET